ncbi:MAG: energy-coupling factor ABC transporter permease [Microcystaceae cyanobacterium]
MAIAFPFLSSAYLGMHIPDGFLSWPVALLTWAITASFLAIALKKVQQDYQDRLVPLMGVCAAFIFAAQMIKFPIPGGTSGHLLGGTLAGILLGPWAGSLVMSIVFMVQAIFFQDGGITALGANILNVGLVGTFAGYYCHKTIRFSLGRNRWTSMAIATAITAWLSVIIASVLTALQLGLSETIPFVIALIALLSWHLMIGIGEAIITVLAINYIWRSRPDLLYDPPRLIKQI